MNSLTTPQLSEGQVSTVFGKWWPDLEIVLEQVDRNFPAEQGAGPPRAQEDILSEVLSLLRDDTRHQRPTLDAEAVTDEADAMVQKRAEIKARMARERYRSQIRRMLEPAGLEDEAKFARSKNGDLIVRLPPELYARFAAQIRQLSDEDSLVRVRVSRKVDWS